MDQHRVTRHRNAISRNTQEYYQQRSSVRQFSLPSAIDTEGNHVCAHLVGKLSVTIVSTE